MSNVPPSHHPDHDLGPDDFPDLDWTHAEPVDTAPDMRTVLEVPVTAAQVERLHELAASRGVDAIAAVQALVQEGLERRSGTRRPHQHPDAAPTGARPGAYS